MTNNTNAFFTLINDLAEGMRIGKANERLMGILNELSNYTVTHFGYEENLFAKHGYPEAKEHKKQHEVFIDRVKVFKDKFNPDKRVIAVEITTFLFDWLRNHINGTDKKYSGFLTEKGVK